MEKRFITHIVPEGLPANDLWRKLQVYTQAPGNDQEFFLGLDNFPLTPAYINQLVAADRLVVVPPEGRVDIVPEKSIWCNRSGEIFIADAERPRTDPVVRFLFLSDKLLELCK